MCVFAIIISKHIDYLRSILITKSYSDYRNIDVLKIQDNYYSNFVIFCMNISIYLT